jgi:hypothetical protein
VLPILTQEIVDLFALRLAQVQQAQAQVQQAQAQVHI